MANPSTLTEAEIRGRLAAEAPRWTLRDGALTRAFRTYGWKGSLMAANAVGHLAEAAWHHPDLIVSYDRVEVRLSSHDAGGVTGRDIALARHIDRLLDWRPDGSDGLEGNPSDAAHGYIRYED